MSAQQQIKDAQKKWAEWHKKPLHSTRDDYLDTIGANLRQCLSARALEGYANGDGSELKDTRRSPAKMKALHSSSVLAANVFDYWTIRAKTSLLSALGVGNGSVKSLDHEAKFPTAVSDEIGSNPPNLDVAIRLDSDHVVAVESKFTEWVGRSTVGKSNFRRKASGSDRQQWDDSAYFPESHGRWGKVGLTKCQELARELNDVQKRNEKFPYQYLDPVQLLKHALGLATQLGKGKFSFYYLYYDWCCEESKKHKDEIARFAERVGEQLRFKILTYQEVYRKLSDATPPDAEYQDYLCYLRERYFCGKGAPK